MEARNYSNFILWSIPTGWFQGNGFSTMGRDYFYFFFTGKNREKKICTLSQLFRETKKYFDWGLKL